MLNSDQPSGPDVPDVSAEWYRDTVAFAHETPSWLHSVVEVCTEVGVIVLIVLTALAAWRARGHSARTMALALLAPLAAAVSYGFSELIKSLVDEFRPCRALAGVDPIAACPPPGDWSLPSNHTTVAAAAAIGIVLTWRWLGAIALLLTVLVAYSRIFLGVHYPHDVAVGFLLGALVTALVVLIFARPATKAVTALRGTRVLGPVLQS